MGAHWWPLGPCSPIHGPPPKPQNHLERLLDGGVPGPNSGSPPLCALAGEDLAVLLFSGTCKITSKKGCYIKRRRGRRIPPLFVGHPRSIPKGMIFDVQPLVKSFFCPINQSRDGFFDFEASIA